MKNIVEASSPVRMKYSDRFADRDLCWRRFHRELARRERFRLIRRGVIIPEYRMPPQMMVKDAEGNWKPEIKHVTI